MHKNAEDFRSPLGEHVGQEATARTVAPAVCDNVWPLSCPVSSASPVWRMGAKHRRVSARGRKPEPSGPWAFRSLGRKAQLRGLGTLPGRAHCRNDNVVDGPGRQPRQGVWVRNIGNFSAVLPIHARRFADIQIVGCGPRHTIPPQGRLAVTRIQAALGDWLLGRLGSGLGASGTARCTEPSALLTVYSLSTRMSPSPAAVTALSPKK